MPPSPPQHRRQFYERLLDELVEERVEARRGRRNIRAVKQKVGKFPVKRQRSAQIQAPIDPDSHEHIQIIK